MDEILATQDWSEPPKTLSEPQKALWWLKKGGLRMGPEWERAHAILASGEGNQPFDWIHALAHWIEADMGNADYWYRQAGKKRTAPNVAAEWEHLATELSPKAA